MAYKLKHRTLKKVNGYLPTSYENVPVRDGIATAQRPISVKQLEARGWSLIGEVDAPAAPKNTVKKKADKKKKGSKKA